MALPSGYKRLEYIQSSGTQYIDTGFKPNQDTRVVATFETQNCNGDYRCVFCARTSANNTESLGFYLSDNDVFTGFYGANTHFSFSGISVAGKHTVDWNKNAVTLDGVTQTLTAQTFNSGCPLFICAVDNNGTVYTKHFLQGKIYSLSIYDSGTIVRAFIPCQTPSGEVGLWDDVNSRFYGNAGTGTFTAGPVIPSAPSAPANFRQTSQDYFEIGLAWDVSEGATGYNLYKDGALIYTGTDLSYLDTQGYPSTSYVYQVTAFSADGEGDPATLEASTKVGWVVIEPVFLAASISPNPVVINQSILISVQLTDAVRILEAETFYSGELYAGEV